VHALAGQQAGVISRRQALEAGMSSSAISRRTAARWRVLHPGVYFVDACPLSAMGRVWAALLYARSPAATGRSQHGAPRHDDVAIAGQAALWLWGALDECPTTIDVAVPSARRVRRQPGVRIVRRNDLAVQPLRQPPRLRLEPALLDAVDRCASPDRVVGLVLAAGQRQLTSPPRIQRASAGQARLRWRALVSDLCEELQDGVHSPLERHYVRRVERPHGLPRGERNLREAAPSGAAWYRDVRYRKQRLGVELDGRGAHPIEAAFRDRLRDNQAARLGDTTLRYGWREVVASPCEVAAEVAHVLALGGWTGQPRPCMPSCPLSRWSGTSWPLSG
jgi:hypothetical protein